MILYKYSASSKHLSICASNPVVPYVREEESLAVKLRKVGELSGEMEGRIPLDTGGLLGPAASALRQNFAYTRPCV